LPRKSHKSAAQAGRDAQISQRRRLIEEFALLDREVDNFKPRLFRHGKLRELILDWNRDLEPDQERLIAGESCDILISSRDRVRTVTLDGRKALMKLWGTKDFIARSIVLLKSLPDPKDEQNLYTVQELSGPRHLHVVARDSAAKPAA
jgi:hypothetical protein